MDLVIVGVEASLWTAEQFAQDLKVSKADLAVACTAALLTALCFFFFFFCLLGYRGSVHPPSADEGTERTWFEPEQQPRKRVPKRSVHGKQSPQGASKMSWRQDDQPCWQGRSCHDTYVPSVQLVCMHQNAVGMLHLCQEGAQAKSYCACLLHQHISAPCLPLLICSTL